MCEELYEGEELKMPTTEIVAETTFSSVIHNNEVSDEIVKWGNANGYSVQKAKLYNKMNGYVGFSKDFFILATKLPPIPGGWKVTVEKFEALKRVIPLNVNKKGEISSFIKRMMEEYKKEGLIMELSEDTYNSYGTVLCDLNVEGHPLLIDAFEEFIENMR